MTPPHPERRRKQVIFKVTDGERDQLAKGAGLAKLKFSTWARAVLLTEVERLERQTCAACAADVCSAHRGVDAS